jgi:hypothetical protein
VFKRVARRSLLSNEVHSSYVGFEILIALMMEPARTSETLGNFYQTTRHYNLETQPFSQLKYMTITYVTQQLKMVTSARQVSPNQLLWLIVLWLKDGVYYTVLHKVCETDKYQVVYREWDFRNPHKEECLIKIEQSHVLKFANTVIDRQTIRTFRLQADVKQWRASVVAFVRQLRITNLFLIKLYMMRLTAGSPD